VSGQLLVAGSDGEARCVVCGAKAVGPCARCHAPLCGDCCVITTGGVKPWAICPRCARASSSLRGAWWRLALWIVGLIVGLGVVLGLLELTISWAIGP
jgi:hypothetical protein